jgi:molybdate/tungstate transport system substrate-binding protein
MKFYRTVASILILSSILVISCTSKKSIPNTENLESELIIFHAGSLSVPFHQLADSFMNENPGVKVLMEGAGSTECARKISELKKPCDIMASSDYTVIKDILIPDYANWYVNFATNEIGVAYTEKSGQSENINKDNWFDILLTKKIIFGRANPNLDPCGYRTIFAFLLSEKYYKKAGLAKELTNKDENFIRPKEVDLLALLESKSLDYIFIYKSVAIQHKLKFLSLPEEINQSNPAFSEYYSTAKTEVTGKDKNKKTVKKVEPMLYATTVLKNAPHKNAAIKFMSFLLSEKGQKIMEENGQPSINFVQKEYIQNVPDSLKRYVNEK